MSTAGKVLVFLMIPLIIAWGVLMSGVAHYNRTGTKALQAIQKDIQKAEDDLKAVKAATIAHKDDINLEQIATAHENAVLQDKKAAVQKQQSDAIERERAATYALENQQHAFKAAEKNRDDRIAEKNQEVILLKNAEDEVEKLKQVDSEYRVRLKYLRDEFKRTYDGLKLKVVQFAS